jgi:hypothetical protein
MRDAKQYIHIQAPAIPAIDMVDAAIRLDDLPSPPGNRF